MRSAVRTWRGCDVHQFVACSSRRHRPGLDRSNTATTRRHGLRRFVVTTFKSRGARPARFSPRGVSAARPRSTRTAQCRLARLCCGPTQGALLTTSLARAQPHRHPEGRWHRPRSFVVTTCESRCARPARISPRAVSSDRPRSMRSAVRTGVVVLWANAGRTPPHFVGQGSTALTSRQVGSMGFGRVWSRRLNPMAHGPRAFRLVEYRPIAHEACAAQCGLRVVVLCANAGRAPHHAVGKGSTAPTSQQVSGTDFDGKWPPCANFVARRPRALRAVENWPTTCGCTRAAQCGLGVVVTWANPGRTPPLTVGQRSTAPI